MGQGFHDFIDFNVEAEALGYHSTFLVEHHFTGWNQVSATLTLLTWLAARTTTLRLGTAVMVLPWHNPVILAEQAATLDLLSEGRLDFGVGKGYRYNEFTGFAIPLEGGRCAVRRGACDHHQSMDFGATLLAPRSLLDVQRHLG
jgi:alkanesulfonate monooxygenase SsuD/methylene tetrahydromethanopterin reductase-like flavin-dependent oxidoreductase (luciferase family)